MSTCFGIHMPGCGHEPPGTTPSFLQAAEVLAQTACLMFDGDRDLAADSLIAAALSLGRQTKETT